MPEPIEPVWPAPGSAWTVNALGDGYLELWPEAGMLELDCQGEFRRLDLAQVRDLIAALTAWVEAQEAR